MSDGFCLVDNPNCSSYNACSACMRAAGEKVEWCEACADDTPNDEDAPEPCCDYCGTYRSY